jgi:hypothetical protein
MMKPGLKRFEMVFLALLTLATSACTTMEVTKETAEPQDSPGPEAVLNAGAYYVSSIFTNTLSALELIAATPEAKAGEWQGIKPYLSRLAADLPGVYFFVLPDGNYYSVTRDFTNLNLRDRPYFDSLFAGNPVMGFPIYSRSSGKKSALVAAPIVVDGKVTGALGASVFLDELNAQLNREFTLPQNYTWFVLDPEGVVMLDRESDFIFMSSLTQGGKSLQQAAAQALKSESGIMRYELEGSKFTHYRKLPGMQWRMFLVNIDEAAMVTPPQLKLSLERFVPALQQRLNRIDAELARLTGSRELSAGQELEIRKLLQSVIRENPDVVNAAFIDARGWLRQIEPTEYRNFENVDISGQAQVKTMLAERKPVFSSAFTAVEGFLAVDVAHPLYGGDGAFIGCVSALIRPELLVDTLLTQSAIPADYELWIMQPDGLMLYDQDKAEIGRMLFSDPLYAGYENLLKLGRTIASTPSGEGSYLFAAPGREEKVIKNAIWQTVMLHGREWRVVLAYRPYALE